jgi:hypothetical protein
VVLTEGRVFVARTPAEIRRAFPDHERLGSLGIGSIMNVPIAVAGRCLGVMNVSHEANWFTREDAEHGRVIAALLAPALLGAEDGGGQRPGRATHALTTRRQGRGSERATGRGSSERGAARGAGS